MWVQEKGVYVVAGVSFGECVLILHFKVVDYYVGRAYRLRSSMWVIPSLSPVLLLLFFSWEGFTDPLCRRGRGHYWLQIVFVSVTRRDINRPRCDSQQVNSVDTTTIVEYVIHRKEGKGNIQIYFESVGKPSVSVGFPCLRNPSRDPIVRMDLHNTYNITHSLINSFGKEWTTLRWVSNLRFVRLFRLRWNVVLGSFSVFTVVRKILFNFLVLVAVEEGKKNSLT